MSVSSLPLSSDSLIVAVALSPWMPGRHIVPLIALFGACDAAASAIGPALGVQFASTSLLGPAFLLLWGATILVATPSKRPRFQNFLWAYVLPPILAIDNLVVPAHAAVTAGVASSLMAALGFCVGLPLVRGFSAPRAIGAMTAGAALLLVA